MIVRSALTSDIPVLQAIEAASGSLFADVPGLEWIAGDDVLSSDIFSRLISIRSVWVLEEDNAENISEPAGFLAGEVFAKDFHVWQLSVSPAFMRRRLGLHLLMQAEDQMGKDGCEAVTLTTFRDVPWNAPYYRQLGYQIIEDVDLSERLKTILNNEAARGMPPERRCAMVKPLK